MERWLVLLPSSHPTSISMATALAHHKHTSIIAAIKALDAAAVTLKSGFWAVATRAPLEKTAVVSHRSRQQRQQKVVGSRTVRGESKEAGDRERVKREEKG
ncbi:hypothetical protein E2C01_081661 [Portunus trituberculatus]|uniref:Uncharacterized protein n=1 Tax=Portunus trituberculatus TaxID=210409 RepID=A0A5B7IWH1_PORTR|nr:hypothetical protein [Portunus trituberculatus]